MKIQVHPLIKGFSLIELLVAVSIFAIVALVLYSSFRGGIISWRRIDSETAMQQGIRYTLDTISGDLKNMVSIANIPFEGLADRISFACLVRSKDKTTGNSLSRVSYYIINEEDSPLWTIIRTEHPLRYAISSIETEETETIQVSKDTKQVKEQRIVSGVSDFKLRYLTIEETEEAGDKPEFEWLEVWDKIDELPTAVEIGLTFTDSTKEITLDRRVSIPIVAYGKRDRFNSS